MALNGISTLATKELKQTAKLALAQSRKADITSNSYRAAHTLDITLLPTVYVNDAVSDNPNIGGLQDGRPWTL